MEQGIRKEGSPCEGQRQERCWQSDFGSKKRRGPEKEEMNEEEFDPEGKRNRKGQPVSKISVLLSTSCQAGLIYSHPVFAQVPSPTGFTSPMTREPAPTSPLHPQDLRLYPL